MKAKMKRNVSFPWSTMGQIFCMKKSKVIRLVEGDLDSRVTCKLSDV